MAFIIEISFGLGAAVNTGSQATTAITTSIEQQSTLIINGFAANVSQDVNIVVTDPDTGNITLGTT